MALTSTTTRSQYTANGSTVAFATGFYFLENSDVTVSQTIGAVTTTLNQGSDYTVTGAFNPSGGTITCAVAPVSGAIITIVRQTPLTQQITFVDNDALPAASLEEGLDKLTMEIQELTTGGSPLSRAIQFPVTEPSTTNTILPNQAGRIGKVFGFDINGNIYLFQDIGTFRGNWVTATAYNFRDIFTDPATQNLYFVTTNYTSGASVVADVTAGDAILVINVTAITPAIAANTILANLTGSTAAPIGTSLIAASNALDLARADLASAATVNIGAATSSYLRITGTTTITAFDTVAAGIIRSVLFGGALTLTYNATTVILPGAANITTAAGDSAVFISEGSGNWRCLYYSRANGQPVAPLLGAGVATALAITANESGGFQTCAVTTYTPSGTTQTIDFSLGNYYVLNLASATGTIVLTFINAGAGTNAVIEMVQGSTARNCTFPANTIQFGGGGVTYTASGVSAIDLVAIGFKDATHARIAVTAGYA